MRSLNTRHPEWWVVALSVAAWLVIAGGTAGQYGDGSHSARHAHFTVGQLQAWVGEDWLAQQLSWSVMVLAMMLPLTVAAARRTAESSLWCRRHRAIAWYLVGYLAIWELAGVPVCLAAAQLRLDRWSWFWLLPPLAFIMAAVWQLTSWKARALRACHRTVPIAPTGWRAKVDCVRYGCLTARTCLLSCWAMMLACAMVGHNLVAMGCASAVAVAERCAFRPYQRPMAALLVGVGLMYATAIL